MTVCYHEKDMTVEYYSIAIIGVPRWFRMLRYCGNFSLTALVATYRGSSSTKREVSDQTALQLIYYSRDPLTTWVNTKETCILYRYH